MKIIDLKKKIGPLPDDRVEVFESEKSFLIVWRCL